MTRNFQVLLLVRDDAARHHTRARRRADIPKRRVCPSDAVVANGAPAPASRISISSSSLYLI